MYATFQHSAQSTSDLAASLTDVAIEVLARAGTRGDSVVTELTLWHTLRADLDREPRGRRLASRHDQNAPLDGELRQIVYRAVQRVGGEGLLSPAAS